MKYFLGCDSHSAYSVIVSMDETGRASSPLRLDHSDEKGIEERETKDLSRNNISISKCLGLYLMQ